MTYRAGLAFVVPALLAVVLGLNFWHGPDEKLQAAAAPAEAVKSDRVVFVLGGLGEEEALTATATLAAAGQNGLVVLDTPQAGPSFKTFCDRFRPDQVVPIGTFAEGIPDLEKRLGLKTAPALEWKRGPPEALWQAYFPKAERVVVCPAKQRGLLLQAACLAGALHAPLVVTHGEAGDAADVSRRLAAWGVKEVVAVGDTAKLELTPADVRRVPLADEDAVAKAYLQAQLKSGPVQNLVVANPADLAEGKGGLSTLAPWVALQRRAALLLTNEAGDNVAEVVAAALKNPDLHGADALLLVANLRAIPMNSRANPAAGKDERIQMEPLTPEGNEPFTFATGRLFHEDRGVVALMLARPNLLPARGGTLKALVASNPGGSLPLLETFSRNTAKELRNGGYQTTALFDADVNKEDLRKLLPEQNLFLWEGHYRTLIDKFEFPTWDEPLQPSLVFLQSCLALNEKESQPLLRRGAVAVVGSATRNYSGSGGAFSLAFFDAMLYDDQTLGGSLRHAKNFLLCYALLKEKRLGEAKLGGANIRSAWAFTLWGDPTLKFPRPAAPADALTPIRHEVKGDRIVVELPGTAYEKVSRGRFQAQMLPNARLAGLLRKDETDDSETLVPFVFVEVPLPKGPANKVPRLRGKLSDKHWVFTWDDRRRCGYLLITPREQDQKELRFQVEWED